MIEALVYLGLATAGLCLSLGVLALGDWLDKRLYKSLRTTGERT